MLRSVFHSPHGRIICATTKGPPSVEAAASRPQMWAEHSIPGHPAGQKPHRSYPEQQEDQQVQGGQGAVGVHCRQVVGQQDSQGGVAIVNFDAFDDVTGKLSFALTLLNELNCGVIITSLYGHNSCNTYVRAVNNGMTSVKLLEEEKLSLANAVNNSKEG